MTITTDATTTTAITTTAWLTRIILNPAHRQVHYDLGNAAALHRRVMKLLPDHLGDRPRAQAGVLFRLEPDSPPTSDSAPATPLVLLQTQVPPDTSQLPTGYARHAQTRSMQGMLGALRPALPVRYRILGNAVRRCGPNSAAGKWKQVIPLHGAEADQWWANRASPAGLDLLTVHSEAATSVSTRHDETVRINRSAVLFEGTATVRDPEALRTALLQGIGRSKSYGCGLLSLAPANGAGT
ncbi:MULTISPECIES: type I-E CRISPR-associated protein Cas6/Cse3/CasE [unclassified Streptomyces]|uniref:type I-E CRISPR-associated protein Cas6/Cse3/CasE n=1 Tax=unclassified Streptomyces TaxID=2593676 RepID=UPI00342498AE